VLEAMATLAEASDGHLLVACTELSLLTAALSRPYTDSLDCLVTAIRDFACA
jgi:aspartate racemase